MITYNRVTPPEMLNKSKYDNSDYYRLGSIIIFLIIKEYLFTKKKNHITNTYNHKTFKNYTSSCLDFLSKLLASYYKKREGFKDIKELMNHHGLKD